MSLDRGDERLDVRVAGFDDLVAYFRSGEKPRDAWRVGTEHEKIGIYADGLARVPFEGERGIERLLRDIAERDGWEKLLEDGHVVALSKQGATLTLAPGGQLELSGAPLRTIHDTCREFQGHLAEDRNAAHRSTPCSASETSSS